MSSFKINQIKDVIIAEAQGTKEFTGLPPLARTAINKAIEETSIEMAPQVANSIDIESNKVLNQVPNQLIGPNNPLDIVNSNLSVSDLTNNIGGKVTGPLTDMFSDKLTELAVGKFQSKLPPILRSSIDISSIANAVKGGINSGLSKGINHGVNLFSGEALSGKIPQLPTVPQIPDIYNRLGSQKGFEEINKQFDSAQTNEAIDNAKKFNVEKPENSEKIETQTTGFVDNTATFPDEEYKDRTEVNKLSTGDVNGTIVQTKNNERIIGCRLPDNETFDQPEIPYAAEYPFNRVIQTESGHIIEMDDTPGSERLSIHHANGTFIELDQTGSIVERTKGSQYRFVDKNDHLSIEGERRVSVSGSMQVYCAANVNLEVEGDVNLKCFNDITAEAAGTLNLSATEEINLNSANINIQSTNFTNLKTDGSAFISAKDSIHNKCNSSMFLHTLQDMHINSSQNFNLFAQSNMSLIASDKMISSADSIAEQCTTYNEKASTINMNNPSYSIAANPPGIASVATYANNANIGAIGERKTVFSEFIDNPTFSNFLDIFGYESEDSEDDKEADKFLSDQKLAGLGAPIVGGQPPELERSSVQPTSSTVIQPAVALLDQTSLPNNFQLSDNFTLGQLSSRAVVTKKRVQAQLGLTYGEIAFNLQGMALNVCEPILALFPNMFVTSGFRHPKAGSRNTSDHLKGQAVDMQFRNVKKSDYYTIAEKIAENCNFDKLLLEYKDTGTKLPWIHVSFKVDNPRKIILTYNNHKKVSSGLVRLA